MLPLLYFTVEIWYLEFYLVAIVLSTRHFRITEILTSEKSIFCQSTLV